MRQAPGTSADPQGRSGIYDGIVISPTKVQCSGKLQEALDRIKLVLWRLVEPGLNRRWVAKKVIFEGARRRRVEKNVVWRSSGGVGWSKRVIRRRQKALVHQIYCVGGLQHNI